MYVSDSGVPGDDSMSCDLDVCMYVDMYRLKFMSWSLRLGFLCWEIWEEAGMLSSSLKK